MGWISFDGVTSVVIRPAQPLGITCLPCHFARRQVHCVFRVLRDRHLVVLSLTRSIEVLHADWFGQVLVESGKDVFTSQLLERRSGSIEVPILVLKVGAGSLRSSAWRQIRQLFICRRKINARPGGKEMI